MKKRNLITLLLCVTLLTGTVGAAFAPQEKPELSNSIVWGTVETIEGSTLHVKNSAETALSDVIIHMSPDAPIIDAVTGAAIELSSVKAGQMVYVTVAPAMALSLPPQASGLALITNIPADYKVPEYAVIDRVLTSDKEGVLAEILTTDGQLQAKITAETTLSRYTKPGEAAITSIPTVEELKPGCGVFVWYGASTKSIPAQTTLTQCVIVPSAYDGYAIVTDAGIDYNGAAVTLQPNQLPTQNEAGDVLVPLRPVAEAAGWKLTWAGKDQPIVLTKGEQTVTLTLGSETYTLGQETYYVSQPTQIVGGVTFVDSLLLMRALNVYTTLA